MIFLILIIGFCLRLINLNQSLWLDEAVQAITSKGQIIDVFSELTGDFHPPLYHLFMWFWVHMFGSSEIILRLPSVLFGVATIYIVYHLAREIFPKNRFLFAELTALFLATAPFHIYYSQEARPYALVTLLVSLSMYFFLKKKWGFYVIATVLTLYSSYFMFFVLIAQCLIIWRNKQYSSFRYILISLLFFLLWLPMFLKQIAVGREAVSILPQWSRLVSVSFVKAIPLTFIKFILGRITIFDKTFYAAVAGILFLVYGGIIARGFLNGKKLTMSHQSFIIFLWLTIPIFSAWLASLVVPNYQPFRLLLVLPAFYLLLAYGASRINTMIIRNIVVGLTVTVNLTSLGVYYFNPYFHREDWRGAVNFIEVQDNAVAVLPSSTSDWPWRYYSLGTVKLIGISPGVRQVISEDFNNLAIQQFNPSTSFTLIRHLAENVLRVNNPTIYYIRYLQPLFDPQEKILLWLKENGYNKTKEISFNQIPVWEFTK